LLANVFCNVYGIDAKEQENLDSVIVATDDMRIARLLLIGVRSRADFNNTPLRNRSNSRSGTQAKEFAFIVNIQGDEPLVDPRLIDKIVEKLRSTVQSGSSRPRTGLNTQRTRCPLTRSKWLSVLLGTPSISRARRFHSKRRACFCPFGIRASTVSGGKRAPAVCEVETQSAGTR
jgi:hypothetical protein